VSNAPPSAKPRREKNRVFIVHGHDDGARETVARLLERLQLEAIVLHEKASGGKTVIEKLEHYSDVDFAVVLLTPDDIGAAKTDAANLRPRARQNVVLELGLFIGLLSRKHVCALHKGNVELPSDFAGVVYVSMDDGGAWKFFLGRELIEAGFNVDLNRIA
jgi:predicted nucleotide-binding protein